MTVFDLTASGYETEKSCSISYKICASVQEEEVWFAIRRRDLAGERGSSALTKVMSRAVEHVLGFALRGK